MHVIIWAVTGQHYAVETRHVVDVVVYGSGSYPGVISFGDVSGVYNGQSLERWPANRDWNDCSGGFRVRYTPDPGNVVTW